MEDKTCHNCERTMTIDNFDEGMKTCKMCLVDKRKSYHKHKHKNNEAQRIKYKEDEEYRKMKQEYNKTLQSKIVTCDVCNCSMSQAHYYRHKKTYNHQQNLKIKEIDEQEYKFLGSNLKMDKSSHFLDSY